MLVRRYPMVSWLFVDYVGSGARIAVALVAFLDAA